MVLPWALRKHMQRDMTSSGRFRTNRGSFLGAHTQQQRQSRSCSGHCRSKRDKQQPASHQSRLCLGCVPHWQWRQDAAAGLTPIEVLPPVRSSLAGAAPRLLRHGPFHHPAGVAQVAPKMHFRCMHDISVDSGRLRDSRLYGWARPRCGPPRCQAGCCPGHRRVAKQGSALGTAMAAGLMKKQCVLRCGRSPPPPLFKIPGTLKSFHPCAARRYERAQ